MSDTNKHFKFDLDRKLKSWLNFEPNFLAWLRKGKIEKNNTVSAFSRLFIQFSAIEIRSVFSHAKLVISSSQWLKKRWGAHVRWWAIAIFQLTELNIKRNPPCFQYARARDRAKWRHNLCAERMRNANVRNHLKHVLITFFTCITVHRKHVFCRLIKAFLVYCFALFGSSKQTMQAIWIILLCSYWNQGHPAIFLQIDQ